MIYIGIDFGHGETTVSRAPGKDGNPVSQIALRNTNNAADKKIISAVCKKNGEWSFVYDSDDVNSDDLREGFKAMVSCDENQGKAMTEQDKESMAEFAKLVFETIREHEELEYDPNSPENKNFQLGIACPSNWVKIKEDAQQEYLDFFRNTCGLPVDLCIKESDAAFFSKFKKYSETDCVFVIDIGSSTIDFTTYSGKKCISDCCWGDNLGAHMIDDALVCSIRNTGNNESNIQKADIKRKECGLTGNCHSAISLLTRMHKERYFAKGDQSKQLTMSIRYEQLTSKWPDIWEACIKYQISVDEFNDLISDYKGKIYETLVNAKTRLEKYGITPNRILLSGGACRMPFIEKYARKIFEVIIDVDDHPECVVSNGIALYAQEQERAWMMVKNKLNQIDYSTLYKKADELATYKATKKLFPKILEKIQGASDLTGKEMWFDIANFFNDLNGANKEYNDILNSEINDIILENLHSHINTALNDVFNYSIHKSDISVTINANAMFFPPDFFGGKAGEKIYKILVDGTGPHIFTDFDDEKPRPYFERVKIAKLCQKRLCVSNPFEVGYKNEDLLECADSIKSQCLSEARRIFMEEQLFETTFKKC